MSRFYVINILDILEDGNENLVPSGLDRVQGMISTFHCEKNSEIERFLHNNAIDFARKRQAITYFVLDENDDLLAYFALTHKAAQHLVGGGIVYLECEDVPKLLGFYANDANRFREFGLRDSRSEGIIYRQLLRLF